VYVGLHPKGRLLALSSNTEKEKNTLKLKKSFIIFSSGNGSIPLKEGVTKKYCFDEKFEINLKY
jgi:hypothetical protein